MIPGGGFGPSGAAGAPGRDGEGPGGRVGGGCGGRWALVAGPAVSDLSAAVCG